MKAQEIEFDVNQTEQSYSGYSVALANFLCMPDV